MNACGRCYDCGRTIGPLFGWCQAHAYQNFMSHHLTQLREGIQKWRLMVEDPKAAESPSNITEAEQWLLRSEESLAKMAFVNLYEQAFHCGSHSIEGCDYIYNQDECQRWYIPKFKNLKLLKIDRIVIEKDFHMYKKRYTQYFSSPKKDIFNLEVVSKRKNEKLGWCLPLILRNCYALSSLKIFGFTISVLELKRILHSSCGPSSLELKNCKIVSSGKPYLPSEKSNDSSRMSKLYLVCFYQCALKVGEEDLTRLVAELSPRAKLQIWQ
ncbi:unnamed protein product [Moneuplotes crassus]|uniref:Uncharacterized protein n=1 Tax=Euplotes crassus TaxID=5936 RepID=A0AAD1XN78_EUPCR|nr:unnamed protein product [Moneuplotes crassus]